MVEIKVKVDPTDVADECSPSELDRLLDYMLDNLTDKGVVMIKEYYEDNKLGGVD